MIGLRITRTKKLNKRSARGVPCLVLRLIVHGLGLSSVANQLSVTISEMTAQRASGTPAFHKAGTARMASHRSEEHPEGKLRRFIKYILDLSGSSTSKKKVCMTLSEAQ